LDKSTNDTFLIALFEAQERNKNLQPSYLLTTLLKLQNEDGSFVGHFQDCEKSNLSGNNIFDLTYVETIFGLLELHLLRRSTKEQSTIDEAMELGLQFLESSPNTISEEPSNLDDNYVLSLLAFLYSSIKHRDADKMFTRLKARALSNSDGRFWDSDWKSEYPCSKFKRNFTITTTAYALMTYVAMDQPDSFGIAQWLVAQRNRNGLYKYLGDSAVAMRSLDMFSNHSPTSFLLAQRSIQCSPSWKNSTNGIDFGLNVSSFVGIFLVNQSH